MRSRRKCSNRNSVLAYHSAETSGSHLSICVKILLAGLLSVYSAQQLHSQVEVVRVKDINEGPTDAFFFSSLADALVHNNLMYFKANDGVHGEELWVSDGTAAGTTLLKDINPGSGTVPPSTYTPYNGDVFFLADDGVHGRELWVSDGTEAGTMLFMDINEGTGHGTPFNFYEHNGLLYFSANDGVHGQELWVSDGTVNGTYMLKDIWQGPSGNSSPQQFKSFNGKLYFRAADSEHGGEVWVTDGTPNGTFMLKDIQAGDQNNGSEPFHFTVLNNALYFLADDGIHGYELWKTDGTEAGTQLVKDINPGPIGIVFGNFVATPVPKVFNGKMYFGGIVEEPIYYLWETDGTEAGTKMFALPDDSGLRWPRHFTLFNGQMYFGAEDDDAGDELWRTDGTAAGTVRIKDINPGTESSFPGEMAPYNFKLYFTASDGSNGAEIWSTDGTEEGTVKIAPAFATQSDPANMVWNQFREVGGRLLFPAIYEDIGRELYAVTDATVGDKPADDFEKLNLYPNPASDFITAAFTMQSGPVEVMVYNSLGQSVERQFVHTSESLHIDISGLAPGVYLLSLRSEAGRHAKRFVKR